MRNVMVVGGATVDVYIRAENAPIIDLRTAVETKRYIVFDYGGKVNIPFFVETTGGGGTNVSAGLARLDHSVTIISAVGEDPYAERIVSSLSEYGVGTEFIETLKERRTGFSIIIGGYDGERTVFCFRGANNHYPVEKFPHKTLEEAEAIHISSLSGASSSLLDGLAEHLRNFNGVFSWNPGSRQILAGMERYRSLLERCDVIFLNVEEAELFTGSRATKHRVDARRCTLCRACDDVCPQHLFSLLDGRIVVQEEWRCIRCGACMRVCPTGALLVEPWTLNLRDIFETLSEAGCRLTVITDGSRGVQAYDGRNFYAVPAFDADAVDTLGAGDAFVSAFLAAYLDGASVKDAIKWGSANGASVSEHFGAKEGLLTRDALKEYISTHSSSSSTVRIISDGQRA